MKVRDLIARLSALRVAGLLDEWGEELVGTLERQAAPRTYGAAAVRRHCAAQALRSRDRVRSTRGSHRETDPRESRANTPRRSRP
jgi:hypothetical protein